MLFRNLKMFALTFTIVALFVGLSGCEKVTNVVDDAVIKPYTVDVGVIVSQTGKDADAYGLPMLRGFELALEEINSDMPGGLSIMFSPKDDLSSEEGAIAAVQELVDEGVPAIVGIAISDYLEDAFPIAQEAGVVAFSSVSSAAGLSSIGDYVFRAGLAVDKIIPPGVMLTQAKLGYTNVAVIYDEEDTYSVSVKDELQKAFDANSVTVVASEAFKTNDTDFTAQLTNIMNLDPQPDALFIAALSQEMTEIIKQTDTVGIPDTVHLIVPDLSNKEVQAAGTAAEGAITLTNWYSKSNIPGNQAFVQKYMDAHGIEAEPWAAQSYATLYILADAIMKAKTKDAAGIRDALSQTMDFPTILGNFSFDPNGEALYEPIILKVNGGVFEVYE